MVDRQVSHVKKGIRLVDAGKDVVDRTFFGAHLANLTTEIKEAIKQHASIFLASVFAGERQPIDTKIKLLIERGEFEGFSLPFGNKLEEAL